VSKTVLVVDDSVSMRQMVAYTLQQAGFSVLQGGDGQEGLDKLQGQRVELIITDVNMPTMDGITFVKNVRALPNYKYTPILMLTTESQAATRQQGKAAGATGWLVKPFEPNQFLQIVAKVCP
jgi:two-component system, chemotaxis family, chemotaxis protein CheY